MTQDVIINKVSSSSLITIDLEAYYPTQVQAIFDLKEFLFMGLILKEKDFRQALKEHHFAQYKDAVLTITCTADAIIPVWAYMLIAAYAQPYASSIHTSTPAQSILTQLLANINAIPTAQYQDQRVVVKGCGDKHIDHAAYVAITTLLRPVAKSIMYGEPCSTVPIYKATQA